MTEHGRENIQTSDKQAATLQKPAFPQGKASEQTESVIHQGMALHDGAQNSTTEKRRGLPLCWL